MAVDKSQKKKKKREEKQKALRLKAERQLRNEKAEELDWEARNAFRHAQYRDALIWAQKKLKIHPNDEVMREIALRSAMNLKDEAATFNLLLREWNDGAIEWNEYCYILGQLAVDRKDYELGRQVFQALFDPNSNLQGRLTKAKLKEAANYLSYCVSMLRYKDLKPPPPSPAPARLQQDKKPGTEQAPETAPPLGETGRAQAPTEFAEEDLPDLKVAFEVHGEPVLEAIKAQRKTDPTSFDLSLKAYKLSFRTSYDQLICLPTLYNVESLWYQEETARKVMKTFRGRAILADEVGLGKTVEAGLILKEYIMRGLVRSALVLTPSSLVHQWQGELRDKFDIAFTSTNDPLFRQDPDQFWEEPFILASIQTAKMKKHFDAVTERAYDLVIVDEAHHLKNRATLNWKLVNAVRKTFLLMLTATPVQNSLEELYNLVTLLRPGHLKTQKAFKEEFVTRGNPTDPRNREKLRQLLKEVMVRNTRSVTQLHLPPRFATTTRISPTEPEEVFYQAISDLVTDQTAQQKPEISKLTLRKLLEAAGSSHMAALRMLEKIAEGGRKGASKQAGEILALGRKIQTGGKTQKVVELLKASPDQKIIFVNYIATLEYLQQVLKEHGIPHTLFQGGMTTAQKQAAIDAFKGGRKVLLATGTGGEGHNLQFCHMMINYDLPWNPMEIEQRIGRIHRIGQEKDVQVYNFCAAGSLEDHILDVLDRKINMFELVVGEIDMILGRLQGEEEFSDLVYDIWVQHPDEAERRKAFDALAARLKRARSSYEKSKELDEKLFKEDFGV